MFYFSFKKLVLFKRKNIFVVITTSCFFLQLMMMMMMMLLYLQNVASSLFVDLGRRESGHDGLVEHVLQALLGKCRALDILDRLELFGQLFALFDANGLQLVLGQLLQRRRVLSQIDLGAHQQERRLLTVVQYFGHPFLFDVLVGRWTHDAEADEKDVGLRIGERPEPVVVLLAGRVEQAERVRLTADHYGDGVVVEDGRHVLAGKLVRRVRDE